MTAIKKKRPTKKSGGRVGKTVPPPPTQPFAQHQFKGAIEFLGGNGIPKVLMTREAYSRMWHFVDIADKEVGWLGAVRVTPHGDYLIEEVFLLEQEVSAAQTELSSEGQAKLVQHLIDTRPDGVEVANRILFWGHSHVRMSTTASFQDDKQMEALKESGCPWFIRGIFNKLGRMEFTLYLWEAGVKIVDAPWAIYEHVDGSIRAGIEAEFKEKVSSAPFNPATFAGPSGISPNLLHLMLSESENGGVEKPFWVRQYEMAAMGFHGPTAVRAGASLHSEEGGE